MIVLMSESGRTLSTGACAKKVVKLK